jgi:hypothetical protein
MMMMMMMMMIFYPEIRVSYVILGNKSWEFWKFILTGLKTRLVSEYNF